MLAFGQPAPGGLAIDGAAVYWTAWDGTVPRVAKRGGAPTTIGSGQARPHDIAVSPAAVVWTNLGEIEGERKLAGALMALRR